MIRTRLAIAFALLALLGVLQGGFTLWATWSAGVQAERSVVATGLLNQYLELGANKQRLKVWFAQLALAGDTSLATRDLLLEKMAASLTQLQQLEARHADLSLSGQNSEKPTIAALQRNFLALRSVIESTTPAPLSIDQQASTWRAVIDVFDRSEGRDMRAVLEEAVKRQTLGSHLQERELAQALQRARVTVVALTLLMVLLGTAAVVYFVRRMHQPFNALVASTRAIAAGDYRQPVNPGQFALGNSEFDQIARQLQAMALQLEAARASSASVQSALDAAVADRTHAWMRSHEALAKVDARRRQFFAEISHELRTPVTVIRGEAEVALRGSNWPAAEYRQALQRIVEAAVALGARVQDVLQLARSDAEHYTLAPRPCALSAVLQSALHQTKAIAAHRGIVVQDETRAALDAVVWADKERLEQALLIVLDNAVRYSTPPGPVWLKVGCSPNAVAIDITDVGIGIAAGDKESVFERGFRGQQARQLQPDGAGLGLPIAQSIVLAHGGSIEIFDNPLGGTHVSITLPVLQALPQHN